MGTTRLAMDDFSGTRALGAAILKRAFWDVQDGNGQAQEAEDWLRGPDAAEIMGVLGLDTNATEAAISRVKTGPEVRAGNW